MSEEVVPEGKVVATPMSLDFSLTQDSMAMSSSSLFDVGHLPSALLFSRPSECIFFFFSLNLILMIY